MHVETKSQKCCGCTACMAICPTQAIKMQSDSEGFLCPQVSHDICVECGMCVKVCPTAAKPTMHTKQIEVPMQAYAVKWQDVARVSSASGAFFPAVAKYVLETKNGWVCGCVLREDTLMPEHIVSNTWADVQRMQDSKYVQSDMKSCYKKIEELLKTGQTILFTGTSCQVSGLYSFLDCKKISTERLLTIDFFCHGVPSPKIWRDYLRFYEEKKHRKPIAYRFRSKRYGWGSSSRGSSHLNSITYKNTIQVAHQDNVSWASRMWRTVFFSNLCIRNYCHSCPYATINKPADFTMGDFWGIEKFHPEFDDGKGCSVVIARTKKAQSTMSEVEWLTSEKVTLDEAIQKQANAFAPSTANQHRADFWDDYGKYGFEYCAKKYFLYTTKDRVKAIIKRVLFALKIRDIY